jgi:L-fuconolactonase
MPNFPIIDTHLHLWEPNNLTYPWLNDLPKLNRPHLLPEYDKACGSLQVEAMVFMQAEAAFSQALDEAKWVNRIAQKEPRIKTIVPWAPLEKGEGSRKFLEELKQYPLIKGVRRIIQYEADLAFCLQPDFIKGVQILADYNFSFDICISHIQMANTIKMVRQCPDIVFILDHIGKPDIKHQLLEPWKTELKTLAAFPNVCCKISGVVTEADHAHWTKEALKPYLEHVMQCFGFDRLLYGSDWPVVTLAGEYWQWVEALDWVLQGCTRAELQKLFHDNALRIYKIT